MHHRHYHPVKEVDDVERARRLTTARQTHARHPAHTTSARLADSSRARTHISGSTSNSRRHHEPAGMPAHLRPFLRPGGAAPEEPRCPQAATAQCTRPSRRSVEGRGGGGGRNPIATIILQGKGEGEGAPNGVPASHALGGGASGCTNPRRRTPPTPGAAHRDWRGGITPAPRNTAPSPPPCARPSSSPRARRGW